MHIDQANLSNLIGLWKKYGATHSADSSQPVRYMNTHWPYRCWFDWQVLSDKELKQHLQQPVNNGALLDGVPESAVIPVWPAPGSVNGDADLDTQQWLEKVLLEQGWVCSFEQTAMYLALSGNMVDSAPTDIGFQMKAVASSADIAAWVTIGSEAFAYTIDREVIEPLTHDPNIQILLGYYHGQPVACALLYKTGDIIGIHQLGVKTAFQGIGIARCFMQALITRCQQWQGKSIVLQASEAGQPLYNSLGFKPQFLIKNYWRQVVTD